MLPIGPGVVPCQWSKDLKRWSVLLDVHPTPTLCLMSTVVLGDAQHPGKLPERRVLLDLSIGACSAMYPHMLQ